MGGSLAFEWEVDLLSSVRARVQGLAKADSVTGDAPVRDMPDREEGGRVPIIAVKGSLLCGSEQ